eukprot:gene13844-15290_t
MAETVSSLFRKLCTLVAMHFVYTLLGALLFIYIEECVPGKKAASNNSTELVKFEAYLNSIGTLDGRERSRILNITAAYFERKRVCGVNMENLVKWWDFTVITVATIGFGNVTPKTDLGKICLICYAMIGVPLAMAMYTVAGQMVIKIIAHALIRIEVNWLKRRQVRNMERKKCIISFLLLGAYTWAIAFLIYEGFGNLSLVDCQYLIFQTLSTIGYGDVLPSGEFTISQNVILCLTGWFGIGLTATLIASLVNMIHGVNVKKILRKFSKSTRSWSLRNSTDAGGGTTSRDKETETTEMNSIKD